jgi:hypothetical protein
MGNAFTDVAKLVTSLGCWLKMVYHGPYALPSCSLRASAHSRLGHLDRSSRPAPFCLHRQWVAAVHFLSVGGEVAHSRFILKGYKQILPY